ncbi:MAG: PIN-like domain-containing protein [Anaerovoracaceae bacterium]
MVEKVKEYLAKDNSIIVFDTNVFLNLYEYSPHVSDFFIELISYIKDKVVVTSTVKREFYRNHKSCYHRQKKKFENVPHQLKKSTESTKTYNVHIGLDTNSRK